MRAHARQEHKLGQLQLAATIADLKRELSQLKLNIDKLEADLELILALGVEPALHRVAKMCVRKAGAVQTRVQLMQLFELLASSGGTFATEVGALAADVKLVKRAAMQGLSKRQLAQNEDIEKAGTGR